ncbi:MAG: DUF4440 domain-containing protein [Steroidobacteraceae bacterium]
MNILKSAAVVAVGLIALAGCQKAPVVDTAAIETELKDGVRTWLAAYNAGDADAIAARYVDDAVVMSPGAPAATGRDAIRAMIAEQSAATKAAGITLAALDGDTVGVSTAGDMAWHSGGYTVSDASGAVIDSGNYMEVQKNVDGKWIIVRDIWNSDRPPAAAPAAEPAAESAT